MVRKRFQNRGFLCDEGCRATTDFHCSVSPQKKLVNKTSSVYKLDINNNGSLNRVIIENNFERLWFLWTVMYNKSGWDHN